METNSRCALRSGAGGPAFDLCTLRCMVRNGMTNVNERDSSIVPNRSGKSGRYTTVRLHPLVSFPHKLLCMLYGLALVCVLTPRRQQSASTFLRQRQL